MSDPLCGGLRYLERLKNVLCIRRELADGFMHLNVVFYSEAFGKLSFCDMRNIYKLFVSLLRYIFKKKLVFLLVTFSPNIQFYFFCFTAGSKRSYRKLDMFVSS